MKQIYTLVLLIPISLFSTSCDKEKDENPSSTFNYNSQTYTISRGFVSHNWDEQGIYEKQVLLGSKEFHEIYLTSSDYVTLSLRTNNSELTIPDGTYEFSEEWTDETFYWGSVAIGYNTMEETGELNEDVTGGTITVSQDGTHFEFEMDFLDGKKVAGTFHGTLEQID